MPVGNEAVPELLPTPQQREIMYSRIQAYRNTKPIFTIDFPHDGEYVGSCIAGGRSYLHINANGDIVPLRVYPLRGFQHPGAYASGDV